MIYHLITLSLLLVQAYSTTADEEKTSWEIESKRGWWRSYKTDTWKITSDQRGVNVLTMGEESTDFRHIKSIKHNVKDNKITIQLKYNKNRTIKLLKDTSSEGNLSPVLMFLAYLYAHRGDYCLVHLSSKVTRDIVTIFKNDETLENLINKEYTEILKTLKGQYKKKCTLINRMHSYFQRPYWFQVHVKVGSKMTWVNVIGTPSWYNACRGCRTAGCECEGCEGSGTYEVKLVGSKYLGQTYQFFIKSNIIRDIPEIEGTYIQEKEEGSEVRRRLQNAPKKSNTSRGIHVCLRKLEETVFGRQ